MARMWESTGQVTNLAYTPWCVWMHCVMYPKGNSAHSLVTRSQLGRRAPARRPCCQLDTSRCVIIRRWTLAVSFWIHENSSLKTGIPGEANDLTMTTFSAWCRCVRPETCLQTKACRPQASTFSLQDQEWGTQTPSPRRKATSTRNYSSSKRSPQ